jgi:hypothetical protein
MEGFFYVHSRTRTTLRFVDKTPLFEIIPSMRKIIFGKKIVLFLSIYSYEYFDYRESIQSGGIKGTGNGLSTKKGYKECD